MNFTCLVKCFNNQVNASMAQKSRPVILFILIISSSFWEQHVQREKSVNKTDLFYFFVLSFVMLNLFWGGKHICKSIFANQFGTN